MPRRNTTNFRRRRAHVGTAVMHDKELTYDQLAKSLVIRGLCPIVILDFKARATPTTEANSKPTQSRRPTTKED